MSSWQTRVRVPHMLSQVSLVCVRSVFTRLTPPRVWVWGWGDVVVRGARLARLRGVCECGERVHCASEILIANAKSVEIGGAPTYLSRHHVMTRAQVNVNQRTTI
jgi:hypothetical protein